MTVFKSGEMATDQQTAVTQANDLRKLLDGIAHPTAGLEWTLPWRVLPCDGKPTIVSHRGGNLFRGYIGTWKEADLIVEVVNALPGIIDRLASQGVPSAETLCGRSTEDFARHTRQRIGYVSNHPRKREHIWTLIVKAVRNLPYISLEGSFLQIACATPGMVTSVADPAIKQRCTAIADQAVPTYRSGERNYSCTSHTAKRWQAAWEGACIALGRNPADFAND